MEFCRFLEPTPAETAERSAATARVTAVIQAIWPQAEVQVSAAQSARPPPVLNGSGFLGSRVLKPSAPRSRLAAALLAHLLAHAAVRWVQVFGSFATGLFLPTSDMDLVVTSSGESPSSRFPTLLSDRATSAAECPQARACTSSNSQLCAGNLAWGVAVARALGGGHTWQLLHFRVLGF